MDDIATISIVVSLGVLTFVAYMLNRVKKGMAIYYRLGNKYSVLENKQLCIDGNRRNCVFAYVAYNCEKLRAMQQKMD